MTLEPTAYHHKMVNDEAGLIVSERLTLSPRFPVNIGEAENPNGLSRETEPLVPLAKALDYAAALVAAERERCAKMLDAGSIRADEHGAHWGVRYAKCWAAAIREGGE
ncbi:hypothetical protein QE368_000837 [Asaia bogorensis NBRC 16594]|nr:hypothetical protein [Asaia bogorensis NBRC 16594]